MTLVDTYSPAIQATGLSILTHRGRRCVVVFFFGTDSLIGFSLSPVHVCSWCTQRTMFDLEIYSSMSTFANQCKLIVICYDICALTPTNGLK